MKLTIDEVITSPYINELSNALEQLEHCEYEPDLTYYRVLYKGLPYLIKQAGNRYTLLGFTWFYGKGSISEPYYSPTPHIKKCKGIGKVFKGIKEIHTQCINIPEPGGFPKYAAFVMDDPSLWDRLKVIMKGPEGRGFIDKVLCYMGMGNDI